MTSAYGTNSRERTVVPIILALTSIGIAWLLAVLLDSMHIDVPWYLDAPSPLLIFGLLYSLFEKVIWSWSAIRRLGLVSVPNLNGTWIGEANSSAGPTVSVELRVHQTWRSISLVLSSATSRSRSTVAALDVGDPGGPIVTYQYMNEPRATVDARLETHRGTATLQLIGAGTLDGEYYTGRGRLTQGTLRLTLGQSAMAPR